MNNRAIVRQLLPEHATVFVGFDFTEEDTEETLLVSSLGYDTFLGSIYIDTVNEEDCEVLGSVVSVSIILVSEKEFKSFEPKKGYLEITDKNNSKFDISLANRLGIYDRLEYGLEDHYKSFKVSEYSLARFRIFISQEKDSIEVVFYLE